MKPTPATIPESAVRMPTEVEFDRPARTIRSTIMTEALADDGGVVMVGGMSLERFRANPVVMARHGFGGGYFGGTASPVIGHGELEVRDGALVATTRFADTVLGNEYAYLYGLNDEGVSYMRAWSVGWNTFERRWLTVRDAVRVLGPERVDVDRIPEVVTAREDEGGQGGRIWVVLRGEVKEYSAVPVGADKDALSRAAGDGVRAAGEVLAAIDFQEAGALLRSIQTENRELRSAVDELREQLQALRGDGSDTAARGDLSDLLTDARSLLEAARTTHEVN